MHLTAMYSHIPCYEMQVEIGKLVPNFWQENSRGATMSNNIYKKGKSKLYCKGKTGTEEREPDFKENWDWN